MVHCIRGQARLTTMRMLIAALVVAILIVGCTDSRTIKERCIAAAETYQEAFGAEACPVESLQALRYINQSCPMVNIPRYFIQGEDPNPCAKHFQELPLPYLDAPADVPVGFEFLDREDESD